MKFTPLALSGAYIITLEKIADERGYFLRNWCRETFGKHGLVADFTQFNTSFNRHKHTLRGLHYQVEPFAETKMLQCVQGSIFDVIVDLRPESDTYLQHVSVTLTDETPQLLYIPKGFAHGFLTLSDHVLLTYYMADAVYTPEAARGLRWDDPVLSLDWPAKPQVMSERDRQWKFLGQGALL